MSRGPKRQPADVALRKGNPGKRNKQALEQAASSDNASTAAPQIEIPVSPLPLTTKRAREHWQAMCRHLGELGRLKGGDLCALARYCNKMSDWEALRKAVTTPAGNTRLTYEHTTTAGDLILKPRPEFAMMKDVEVEMLKIEREFGLTPSARAAVTQKLIDAAATQKPPPAARAVPNGQPEPDAGNPPAASVPPAPATPIGILAPRGTKH